MTQLTARTTDLTWREVDQEIVLLDLAASQYYSLNGTAAELWKLLVDSPASESDLTAHLLAEYDVTAQEAEGDVATFIAHCRSLGIVDG